MKKGCFLFFFISLGISAIGQTRIDTLSGAVSYKTVLNVYVRFESTKGISVGDTLFSQISGSIGPALVVSQMSSTSCVAKLIDAGHDFKVGDQIYYYRKRMAADIIPSPPVTQKVEPSPTIETETNPVEQRKEPDSRKKGQFIRGRILAASYVNFANDNAYDVQRMRYTLTMNTRQPADHGFGAETYISFRHTINEWQDVRDNFKQALKIYSLAVGYQFAPGTQVWLGRKINSSISNLGAIDGVQLEKRWHTFTTGLFFGSRPDYEDYGFNSHLVQGGAYVAHDLETRNGQVLSTLAFAEQQNNHHTDRRYLYVQHSNSAIKNINLFGSAEIDLYTLSNLRPKDTFNLTSIYFSIRYRVSRALSLFASYDARKNIIYYESYKNFIDQLLEDETRQGLRFSFNYRLLKKVTLGSSAGLRFERNIPKPSQNVYSYVTVSRITSLQVSATASAVLLRTSYLKGNIFGLRLSRDFFKGKLYTEAEYRNVVYRYGSTEYPIRQSIVGLNASLRISKKLSIAINYEGEIQSTMTLHRIYSSIVNRF